MISFIFFGEFGCAQRWYYSCQTDQSRCSAPNLTRKIVQANLLDISLIAIYTWLMVTAEYLGPYW